MDNSVCCLELLAVLLSMAAWLLSLSSTLLSSWLVLSTDLLPTESYQLGLWQNCVVQESGTTECRAYDSLLGLPPDVRLARILMCTALGAGLAGTMMALPGLYVVTSCDAVEDLRY